MTRPSVLMVAYACDADAGSEPGAGYHFAAAASRIGCRVTLVTRPGMSGSTERQLKRLGVEIRICGPAPGSNQRVSYARWLLSCRRETRRLLRANNFDLVHHVTYASDSFPPGAIATDVPLIWGPIGGGTALPRGLRPYFRRSHVAQEFVRTIVQKTLRVALCVRSAKAARLIIAQNYDTADIFRQWNPNIVVRPNVVVQSLPYGASPQRRANVAVCVGRLVPVKAVQIAIEAISRTADWKLEIIGDGPERDFLSSLVEERNLTDRVDFLGAVSRQDSVRSIASASCLLFTSAHDSAGWVIGEALAVETPVVALAVGGPTYFAEASSRVVPVSPTGDVAGELAVRIMSLDERLLDATQQRQQPKFDDSELESFLSEVYSRCE